MNQESRYFPKDAFPFSNPKRWISAALAVASGAFILILYMNSGPKASSFAQAEVAFAKWKDSYLKEEIFPYEEMASALKKAPSLQEKYEPFIIQALIEGGEGTKALEMSHRSLRIAHIETPFHALFAETSFLIEKGEFQKALEKSASLKEMMAKEGGNKRFLGDRLVGGSFLYAQNLVRIAFLQKALKNLPGEKAAWEELEILIQSDSPSARLLLSAFHEKGVNLTHFIENRKAQLN